ncbi:MAG: hypothetical protein IJI27_07860 [Oscillospiraceae bacterium]|nr:hypothetical protein [Oscillospiraceae bacterium]
MAWISVYEEVDSQKLRKLYKAIGCSKFEALGILNFLWFWGMKNADATGLIEDVGVEEIARYLYGCGAGSSLDMNAVATALIETHWIDEVENGLMLHDWDTWQENWYKYIQNREKATQRKRDERKRQEDPEPPPEDPAPEEKKPKKIKYAEFVSMTEEEHRKLCEKYGEPFAAACIETLSNYKGSKGKTYKSDYLAILNWVVDRVNEKQPHLRRAPQAGAKSGNPFKK